MEILTAYAINDTLLCRNLLFFLIHNFNSACECVGECLYDCVSIFFYLILECGCAWFVLFDILNKHQRHSYLFGCDIYRLTWLFFAVFFEPKRYKVFVYQENHVNTKPAPFSSSLSPIFATVECFLLFFFLLVEFLSCSLLRHELDTGVWITHRKSLKKHFHVVCLDILVVLR